MSHIHLPALWLIALMVGLPQLSETVYSPSLPDIATTMQTSASMVEFTLTIYLMGFALGTLFWGKLSDKLGRKPCVVAGLFIFILGSLGCYLSTSIEALMISRIIQAFGGSVGSVLGQAICRDAFHGPALGKVYSTIGSALALFPAIGPVLGGLISERFGWEAIFIFLILFATALTATIVLRLPETHHKSERKPVAILEVALSLLKNKKVMGFGLIVGSCNGIAFSYFAEGSFFLIKILKLSPSEYGLSFIAIAFSTMLGGISSKKLQSYLTPQVIMNYGLTIVLIACLLFSAMIIIHCTVMPLPINLVIGLTILNQMCLMFGICMAVSNALALALHDYKWCVGTASSLFGFFYYVLISLFTLGMGSLHNGTLLPMPLYFLGIAFFMLTVQRTLIRN